MSSRADLYRHRPINPLAVPQKTSVFLGLEGYATLRSDANLQSYWPLVYNSVDAKGARSGTDTKMQYNPTSGRFSGAGARFISGSKIVCSSGISGNFVASVSLWVKPDNVTDTQMMFDVGANNTLTAFGILIGLNGEGSISVAFAGDNNAQTAAGVITAGVWTHIVITKAAGPINTTLLLYVNGVAVSWASGIATGTPNVTSSSITLGYSTVYASLQYVGAMTDVCFFNDVLSAAEVAELYRQSNSVPMASLPRALRADDYTIGLWDFTERTGVGLVDKSATPHAVVLTGTPLWNKEGPWNAALGYVMTSTQYGTVEAGCNVGPTDFTVEVIFRAPAVPETSNYASTWQHGLVGRVPTDGTHKWWLLGIRGKASGSGEIGHPILYARDTFDLAVIGNVRVDDGNWHYMVGTMVRSSNTASIYVDGVSVASSVISIGTGGSLDELTLKFGINALATDGFTGSMATVRISNVARSAAEILVNARLMGFAS